MQCIQIYNNIWQQNKYYNRKCEKLHSILLLEYKNLEYKKYKLKNKSFMLRK